MTASKADTSCRARSDGRGFSLVEAVAVMIILSFVAVIAVARSGTIYQSRQRAAAQQLTADLQFIRLRAMNAGRSTWATIAPGSDTVTYTETVGGSAVAITDPATSQAFVTGFHTSSEGQNYYGVRIGTVNGSSSTVTLGFDYQGRPLTGAGALQTTNQVITITASIGSVTFSSVSVTINAETGMITFTP